MRSPLKAPANPSQLTVWLLALVCAVGVWAGAYPCSGGQSQAKRADFAAGADALLLSHTEQSLALKRSYMLERDETLLDEPDIDWHVLVDEYAKNQAAQNAVHPIFNTYLTHLRPSVGQLLNAPRAPPAQHS